MEWQNYPESFLGVNKATTGPHASNGAEARPEEKSEQKTKE